MYEQAEMNLSYLHFSGAYGFEPASSIFMAAIKRLGFSYEGLQLILSILSVFALLVIFLKVKPINFVIFTLMYLCFAYYQFQWSVIRNNMAFWTFSVSYVLFQRVNISALASSIFHYSFALSFLRVRAAYFAFGGVCVLFLLLWYILKYRTLSHNLLYSFFFGGWGRLLYHLFLALLFLKLLGFLNLNLSCMSGLSCKLKREPIIMLFVAIFFVGMLFPLGWRLVAVAIPFLLLVDFSFMSMRRFIMYFLFSVIIFFQKSYSFFVSESLSHDYPVISFLRDFYFY